MTTPVATEPHDPQTVVCPECKRTVVPRVVPDESRPLAAKPVTLGLSEPHVKPPEQHFHAECPVCHHRLYAPALEQLNESEKSGFDWQTFLVATIVIVAFVAMIIAFRR
jgi:hypothetical protein